jgi:hypothetical protein
MCPQVAAVQVDDRRDHRRQLGARLGAIDLGMKADRARRLEAGAGKVDRSADQVGFRRRAGILGGRQEQLMRARRFFSARCSDSTLALAAWRVAFAFSAASRLGSISSIPSLERSHWHAWPTLPPNRTCATS